MGRIKLIRRFLFAITTIIAFGCTQSNESRNNIDLFFKDVNLKIDSPAAIIIIPVYDGCESCSIKAAEFASQNHDGRLITVLSFRGEKMQMAMNFMEEYKLDDKRVIIDSLNSAFKRELIFNNPTIIYSHDKNKYDIVVLKPANIIKDLNKCSNFLDS